MKQPTLFDVFGSEDAEINDEKAKSDGNSNGDEKNGWSTPGGHDPFEVVSALQKMIRRGKEKEALYWATELELANYTWLWKRLMTIAVEDIGLADPATVMLVKTMKDIYCETRVKGKYPEGNVLALAVLAMCRAPKNRDADDAAEWMRIKKAEGFRLELPDVALDQHTRRGRAMGRGDEYWFKEASRLHGKIKVFPFKVNWEEEIKEIYRAKGVKTDWPHEGEYWEDESGNEYIPAEEEASDEVAPDEEVHEDIATEEQIPEHVAEDVEIQGHDEVPVQEHAQEKVPVDEEKQGADSDKNSVSIDDLLREASGKQ